MTVYWLTQRLYEVPASNDWLAPGEAATLSRLHIPKRLADWRLGRWTAKRVAAARLGLNDATHYARIEIRAAPSGAPDVFLDGQPAPLAISLSHSDAIGLCVAAPPAVALGCDVEAVAARSRAFLRDYFTAAEGVIIDNAGDAEQAVLATLMWSAKESALKALREGLRLDTRSVEMSSGGTSTAAHWQPLVVRHLDSGQVLQGWWRSAAGHLFTVVAAPPVEAPVWLSRCDPAPPP